MPIPPLPVLSPSNLDVWLTRAASLSQPLVLALAVFGYFYTVLPVYQKEVLSEQIAGKELELEKLQHEIDAGRPAMNRLRSDALSLKTQIDKLSGESKSTAALNKTLKLKQLALSHANSELASEVANKSATVLRAEKAIRLVALRAYHDSFSTSVELQYLNQALSGDEGALLSTPTYESLSKYLLTPYDAISATLAAGDSKFMPSNASIPKEVKDAYHRKLRAFIEDRKDSLSRSLVDVNSLVFQIKSEMALAKVDPTPMHSFNEREYETGLRLRNLLTKSRSQEMSRTFDVMKTLELDSII
jgi:hypothetical protein